MKMKTYQTKNQKEKLGPDQRAKQTAGAFLFFLKKKKKKNDWDTIQ